MYKINPFCIREYKMKDIYISKDKKSSDDFDVVYLDDTAPLPPLDISRTV